MVLRSTLRVLPHAPGPTLTLALFLLFVACLLAGLMLPMRGAHGVITAGLTDLRPIL